MTKPIDWTSLSLPLMAAPMFLASSIDLVIAACRAGVIGAFPTANPRDADGLRGWLSRLSAAEADARATGTRFAPYCVNLLASAARDKADQRDKLAVCREAQVPLILTNMGNPREIVDAVHEWGGLVFHDVTTLGHAKKAVAEGVDGLMLVCAGAGGHAGTLSPFAFVPQVRRFFDGWIMLAGGIADGAGVAAALSLGADFAVMGTRFIATRESGADVRHKAMLVEARSEDVVYTDSITGLPASFLRQSIAAAGLDPSALRGSRGQRVDLPTETRPWRDVWSGGHSVGLIDDVSETATLIDRLKEEFRTTQAEDEWIARIRSRAPG